MPDVDPWWLAGAAAVVLLVLGGRWLWHLGRAVQIERARELFRLQHERFEEMVLAAAAATGKPRGLTWAACAITGAAAIARDPAGAILALVPVEVRFEPVPGSDMEGNPNAAEPRPATAVFAFAKGRWHTDGRVVFNLDPAKTAATFGATVIDGH